MPRKNGFRRPFHILQILTWSYYIFSTFTVTFSILLYLQGTQQILFGVSFYTSAAILLVLGFLLTYIDPSISTGQGDNDYFCSLCHIDVPSRTKHCAVCDRCVGIFDHHCKWLNNCIGAVNYKLFISLVIFFQLHIAFLLTIGIYMSIYKIGSNKYSEAIHYVSLSLLLIENMLNCAIFISNGYLLVFHIVLRLSKKTTYEYIGRSKKVSVAICNEVLQDGVFPT